MRVDLAVGELGQQITEFRLVEEPLKWSASSQVRVRVADITWLCSGRTRSLLPPRAVASCWRAGLSRTLLRVVWLVVGDGGETMEWKGNSNSLWWQITKLGSRSLEEVATESQASEQLSGRDGT